MKKIFLRWCFKIVKNTINDYRLNRNNPLYDYEYRDIQATQLTLTRFINNYLKHK